MGCSNGTVLDARPCDTSLYQDKSDSETLNPKSLNPADTPSRYWPPQAPRMIVSQFLEKHFNTRVDAAVRPSDRDLDILQMQASCCIRVPGF